MANNKMRVEIPRNAEESAELASKIHKKHVEQGTASPLLNLNGRSWDEVAPKVVECESKHAEAEALRGRSEQLIKECNLLFPDIDGIVKASRDVLLGIHHDNPKNLTDWGFTVIESVSAKAKASAKKSDGTSI